MPIIYLTRVKKLLCFAYRRKHQFICGITCSLFFLHFFCGMTPTAALFSPKFELKYFHKTRSGKILVMLDGYNQSKNEKLLFKNLQIDGT